jgi:hypothetical protein
MVLSSIKKHQRQHLNCLKVTPSLSLDAALYLLLLLPPPPLYLSS